MEPNFGAFSNITVVAASPTHETVDDYQQQTEFLRDKLLNAQRRMNSYADKRRTERPFAGGFYFLPLFTWYFYDLPLFTLQYIFCPTLVGTLTICPLTGCAHVQGQLCPSIPSEYHEKEMHVTCAQLLSSPTPALRHPSPNWPPANRTTRSAALLPSTAQLLRPLSSSEAPFAPLRPPSMAYRHRP
jgi:hypothetical protein